MSHTVTVVEGLAAYFKQPSGPSRPGVDWAVEIAGERAGTVIVRTYFSSDPPKDAERKVLADKAVLFVQTKLEEGWIPGPGVLEAD
jgi:hypothetical protein